MFGEFRDNLDAADLRAQLGEDGRLIPRTRADFQDPLSGFDAQPLGHVGHNVGLRDGLSIADGAGMIAVGLGKPSMVLRDVCVSPHLGHGGQGPRVVD